MGAVERAAVVRGVGRFLSGSRYEGVNGEEPTGSAGMTMCAVLRVLRRPSGTEVFVARDNTSARAFQLRVVSDTTFQLLVVDGDPTTIRAEASLPNIDAGDLVVLTAAYEGGVEARIQANGVAGTDASNAGYTEPSSSRALAIGAESTGGSEGQAFAVAAFLIDQQSALSAAQLDTLETELRAHLRQGRDLAAASYADFAPEHGYVSTDAAAEWADRVGSGTTLSRQGAPELYNFRGGA